MEREDDEDGPAESGDELFANVAITADSGAQIKAAVELKCWKEHTCSLCDLPYRYLFARQFSQKAPSEAEAREKAEQEAKRLLASEADYRPCPGCGLVQPDMVGTGRALGHVLLIMAVVLVFVVVFVLAFYDLVSIGILQWIVGVAALGALVGHVAVERHSHNANLGNNQQRSLKMMEDNELMIAGVDYRQSGAQGWHSGMDRLFAQVSAWWIFGLLFLGTCAMPIAETIRSQRGLPWMKNDGLWWICTFSSFVVLCTAGGFLVYRADQLKKRGRPTRVFTFGGTLLGERPAAGKHNCVAVSCPGCQRTLRFAKELAGEQAICPGCGRRVAVQQGRGILDDSPAEQEAAAERARAAAEAVLAELPAPLPGRAKKLGEPTALYKSDPAGEWAFIVIGVALGVGVPILLLVDPWTWAPHPAWLATLCLAAFSAGLYMVVDGYGHLHRRVATFTQGLVHVLRGKIDVIPWSEIESFNQSITHHYTNFIYTGTVQIYTLKTRGGDKLVFKERLINVRLLAECVEREVARAKLPDMMEDFNRGKRLTFGPFSVDRRGLSYHGNHLAWDLVESVKVQKGAVVVAKKGKWMNWAMTPVADVANLMIFVVLVDEILQGNG